MGPHPQFTRSNIFLSMMVIVGSKVAVKRVDWGSTPFWCHFKCILASMSNAGKGASFGRALEFAKACDTLSSIVVDNDRKSDAKSPESFDGDSDDEGTTGDKFQGRTTKIIPGSTEQYISDVFKWKQNIVAHFNEYLAFHEMFGNGNDVSFKTCDRI
eukprot:UN25839